MFLSFPAFSAGELSSLLDGRNDLSALKMGLRKGRNLIPQRLGPALQRPGFMFRGLALDQLQDAFARVKLLPFVATAAAAYVLELSATRMRVWKDGAPVLTTADNIGRPGVVSALGTHLTLSTPYAVGTLRELQWCHSNDVMWLTHESYPVYKLTRYSVDGFYIEAMTFVFPPLRDQNAQEITLAATGDLAVGGTVSLLAAGGDVFLASDVGAYYGIDHRRETPSAEISLSVGSGTASASISFTGVAVAAESVAVGTGSNLRTYDWRAAVEGAYTLRAAGVVATDAQTFADAINGTTNANVGNGTQAHLSVRADDPATFTTGVAATGTLTCTDNALESGSDPDEAITGSGGSERTYKFKNTISAAYDVKIGADIAASLLNLAKAFNASGVAGTDYGVGTLVNPDMSANETIVGSTMRTTALVAGLVGNSIPTTVAHTSRLSWGSSTLTGGADASTTKVQVNARIQGDAGNDIAVAETMTNAAWTPAAFLTGGADNTSYDPSNPSAVIPTVRVSGTWEVYTLGRWYGLLTLQQQRTTGEWEVVRTWDSENDRNVQATGTVDGEKTMRLIFVGSGIADDEAPARAVLTAVDAIVHGLVLITGYTSPTQATGTVVRAIWSDEPTYLWARGAWNERFGYPSSVVLHQQRLVFGQRDRLIGSQVGGFDNFERSEFADASWQYDLAATVQANIVSLQSQRGLIVLTEFSEWLADGGGEGAVITPAAFRSEQLSTFGSARCTPEMIHSNVVFVQAGGLILNEYLFNFGRQNYEAVDLGELAEHFTSEGLRELAWAPVPHGLLYAVTQAGSLLTLAYRRAAGNAGEGGMLAWTKHTTPDAPGVLDPAVTPDSSTDGVGAFESVCAVPGTDEISNVMVCIRRMLPSGTMVRTIESLQVGYWAALKSAERDATAVAGICTLDGGVSAAMLAVDPTMTGLSHLEGLAVQVLLNGMVHPDRVVNGGEIELDMTGISGVVTATAGLAPLVELQPFFATITLRDGGSDGRAFKVAKLNTRFYLSGAAKYADDDEGSPWFDVDFRSAEDAIDSAVPFKTALRKLDLAGGWVTETQFIFRNQSPLPMNILGLTAELEVRGR